MTIQLTREQAQAALARVSAEREAIQANILDLDGSFGKRLLAGATLTGESRRRWERAAAGLAAIWDTYTAYAAVIEQASQILTPAGRLPAPRLERACDLLAGASVQLTRPAQPLGQRELTANGEVQVTLAAAVQEMRAWFGEISVTLTAAEAVWNEVSDGLREAGSALDAAQQQLPDQADSDLTSALAQASASLRELRDLLNSDPLALWRAGQVDTSRLQVLRQQVAAVASRAADLGRLRTDADQRIAEVLAAVEAARAAWQDATAARERAASRVLVIQQSPLPDVSGLARRHAELTGLSDAGRWARLESELDLLGKLAASAQRQCHDAERAALGLLGRRDELRGLLDAYRAKAGRVGAAENAQLEASYRNAHDLLWTAPCDLAAATAAVTRYQQAILTLSRSGGTA
jgi:hypothetical protein